MLVCFYWFACLHLSTFFQIERENECGNGEVDKWRRLGEIRGGENHNQDIVYIKLQKIL